MAEAKNMSFPSNSHKERQKGDSDSTERKKLESVVSQPATKRKKGLGSRVVESFTGEDMRSVSQYLLFDVLIPAAKNMMVDAAQQGIERLLFGDVRPRSSSSSNIRGYTSYNRVSSPSRSYSSSSRHHDQPRNISQRGRSTHNFDEIVLGSRQEAELVLSKLEETLRAYDVATVAELYDLVGITGNFADDKWGWTDLSDSSVRPIRGGGYILNLPRTEPID